MAKKKAEQPKAETPAAAHVAPAQPAQSGVQHATCGVAWPATHSSNAGGRSVGHPA